MDFVRKHPARVYAVVVAALALVSAFGVSLPQAQILGLAGAVLSLLGGEVVQRAENAKTREALSVPVIAHNPHSGCRCDG
jgi:hypothetical protein